MKWTQIKYSFENNRRKEVSKVDAFNLYGIQRSNGPLKKLLTFSIIEAYPKETLDEIAKITSKFSSCKDR